jgi:aminopeptidase N
MKQSTIGLISIIQIILFLNIQCFSKDLPSSSIEKSDLSFPFKESINHVNSNATDDEYYGLYDVLHYVIETEVDVLQSKIYGKTTITIKSLDENLSTFKLDFTGLITEGVKLDGDDVNYSTSGNDLTINPKNPIPYGREFDVEISYSGTPIRGFYFTHQVIYTYAEPRELTDKAWSRYWFPCKSVPYDKATCETITKVPSNLIAASNGSLVEVVNDESQMTSTYHWEESYPIATYLISLAISDYYSFTDYYQNMKLTYFVYPYMRGYAQSEFSDLPDMVGFYSDYVLPYPFEKYGMAVAEFSGAMEHQTLTTVGSNLVTGTKYFNWIYSHELAHQWFGDLVTLTDWKEIWLNEGFATYFDALYTEHKDGLDAFNARLESFKNEYFNSGEDFPIYSPEYMWGATVYEKGGLVLHMLRNVVGDDEFKEIIRKYANEYAYSNSYISDFIKICEDIHGEDLSWFFQEWLADKGYPIYNVSWFSKKINDKNFLVEVAIQQIQKRTNFYNLYKMPFKIEMVLPIDVNSGDIIEKTISFDKWVDDEFEKFTFTIPEKPLRLRPDSTRVSLRKIYNLPEYIPPRYGTCGLNNDKPENLLLVNDSIGNDHRELTIPKNSPFELKIIKPSYLDKDVHFVIYAVPGSCQSVEEFAYLPYDIGTFCFSIPPTSGNPVVIANNIGFDEILGYPLLQSKPASSTVISLPNGFSEPTTFTLQGLIIDPSSESGISMTNAIVINVFE